MTDYKKELEEFIYIVSHDLNAPMRHIKQFGALLFKSLGDKVTKEEKEYFYYMEQAVHKSEDMLNALLSYSRINTEAEKFSSIDCHAIIENILNDYKDPKINTSVENLPKDIYADKKQIQILFKCLLDNAIKFKQPETCAEIEISAEETDKGWLFKVQDNGIGIELKQTEHMFTIFKRGHSDEKYPGVGIGLALAKKIVQRHHGEIWFEADRSNGATVNFTIETASMTEGT